MQRHIAIKFGEELSVANPDRALYILRMERLRRYLEMASSCEWKTKEGDFIWVRAMSDDHLENTIAMLERIVQERKTVLEAKGDAE